MERTYYVYFFLPHKTDKYMKCFSQIAREPNAKTTRIDFTYPGTSATSELHIEWRYLNCSFQCLVIISSSPHDLRATVCLLTSINWHQTNLSADKEPHNYWMVAMLWLYSKLDSICIRVNLVTKIDWMIAFSSSHHTGKHWKAQLER